MPSDRHSTRAAELTSAIDDALSQLQVEDFSELPAPVLPFTTSGRIHDKRRSRVFRPVLQRQKAVLCIEDLHAEGLDSSPVPVARSFSRGYRRTSSLDYPRSSERLVPMAPTSTSQRSLDARFGLNAVADESPDTRIVRPTRGLHWPY